MGSAYSTVTTSRAPRKMCRCSRPITSPSTLPATATMRKAIRKRNVVCHSASKVSGCSTKDSPSVTTLLGAARKSLWRSGPRATSSHATTAAAIVADRKAIAWRANVLRVLRPDRAAVTRSVVADTVVLLILTGLVCARYRCVEVGGFLRCRCGDSELGQSRRVRGHASCVDLSVRGEVAHRDLVCLDRDGLRHSKLGDRQLHCRVFVVLHPGQGIGVHVGQLLQGCLVRGDVGLLRHEDGELVVAANGVAGDLRDLSGPFCLNDIPEVHWQDKRVNVSTCHACHG